jgi:hypothetical protein
VAVVVALPMALVKVVAVLAVIELQQVLLSQLALQLL